MTFGKIKSAVVNPLDFCIILVVICILIGGLFKLKNQQIFMLFNGTETAEISITIPLENNDDASIYKSGVELKLENGQKLGEIKNVTRVKEKRYSAINQTLFYDYTDKNTAVIVDLETKVKINDDRYYINNSYCIVPGGYIDITLDNSEVIRAQVDKISVE